MNVDKAKNVFDELYAEWLQNMGQIETKQDVRFQVINRMLTEVLGWPFFDVKTERAVNSGYVDYIVGSDGRNRLVVEAKRAAKILVDTKNPRYSAYKAGGPALESARSGLEQAQRYCLDTAVPFSALTTGFEWIAFWAIRTDGTPPMDGRALVFPNLDAIKENFAVFYDLFSREGVIQQLFQIHIHEAEGLKIQHAESLTAVLPGSDVRLLKKSKLAADLEIVFKKFFSTMSGENDPDMLAKCFVQSKESREADASLEKITRNLINRIDVVESAEGGELQEHIRAAVDTLRGEFVLIIGNKGAGKSTFIERFFRLVLERQLRDRCLVIRIDLADSDGNIETVVDWLFEKLKDTVEAALFGNRPPTYDELQGIFFSEYERWLVGEHKHLYERDKVAFKEKFGSYIASLVEEHPDKYVRRLLRDSIKSRKLMPCVVFDNTDHFPQKFQEHVFQFAQSIHRNNFSFVICPITDRTIWQLSKAGPLQSYETTAFYLPVPSTKDVLEKRVSYLRERLEQGTDKDKGTYVLTKGLRLSIDNLNAFAACIDDVFVRTDYVSRTVGWLSNHDIRRSLNIAKRIVTSPIVSMEDLVKTYISERKLAVPMIRIQQALIFGDHSQFNQEASDYILNVFNVHADQVTSPLAKLAILRVLMDKEEQAGDAEHTYMSMQDIQNYFEPCGLSHNAVRRHAAELLKYRLIEPYDPTDQGVQEEQRVRLTHCGHIHYEFALGNDVYVSSMALTTGMRRQDVVMKLQEIRNKKMGRADWIALNREFIEYVLDEDKRFFVIPELAAYEGQKTLRGDLSHAWHASLPSKSVVS